MRKNSKKRVLCNVALVFLILLSIAVAVVVVVTHEPNEGDKTISLEIVSDREGFSETVSIDSSCETLGELIRTLDYVDYEESTYGIYIKGFYGMMEDTSNQYWWCLTVDHQMWLYGVDETNLEDGAIYTFTLMQGW